jgi:hypothetical protein
MALLSLVVEDGDGAVDVEVVDSGTALVVEVDEGSTMGRGAAPITGPPAWGRGARFLIIERFIL